MSKRVESWPYTWWNICVNYIFYTLCIGMVTVIVTLCLKFFIIKYWRKTWNHRKPQTFKESKSGPQTPSICPFYKLSSLPHPNTPSIFRMAYDVTVQAAPCSLQVFAIIRLTRIPILHTPDGLRIKSRKCNFWLGREPFWGLLSCAPLF